MNLTKELLTNLFEQSKILKSDIISISSYNILGSNYDYTIIKRIICDNRFLAQFTIQFISKDMQVFIKAMNEINDDLIVNEDNLICGDNILYINNTFQNYHLLDIYSRFVSNTYTKENLILHLDDAKEYMHNVLACKAAEKDLIKINENLMVIMHGSMLPINKNDKVSLDIYRYNDISNIYNMFIEKKKKKEIFTIEVFMLCLNIN